ncbi:MAG: lysophospholipid acyltransferase family protein [Gemmatimonadetes bacterium]|nr:lysophospholipid acyltransferase family protein [Gemmatimonadota bacterium]
MTAPPGDAAPGTTPAPRSRPPKLKHRLEYAAMRAFLAGLAPFGVRGGAAIASAIARLAYWPIGIRRGVVTRQIAAAFPDWDAARVRATAKAAYGNLGRVAVEATLLSRRGSPAVLEMFEEPGGWETVAAANARGRGLIFIAGHLGNWELSGAYIAARGLDVHAIARGMANPLSDRYFRRTRERLGMQVMHDQEAVRRVPRVLRAGGAVGFLSDQATVGLASTFVPFFGRPAKTPRGAAVFALRADVPVVLVQAIRTPSGTYRFHAEELVVERSGDREADVDRLVLGFSVALERLVRQYPEQYFWQHRRWKHQPADTPAHLREP